MSDYENINDVPQIEDNPELLNEELVEEQEHYEGTPEELTSFKQPPGVTWFDRKKVLMVASFAFSLIVVLGIIFSTGKSKKNKQAGTDYSQAARAPTDFLQRERDRSLYQNPVKDETLPDNSSFPPDEVPNELLPKAELVQLNDPQPQPVQYIQYPPQNSYEPYSASGSGAPPPEFVAYHSPLTPPVAGSIFGQSSASPPVPSNPYQTTQQQFPVSYPNQAQDPYVTQNNQANKTGFYNSSTGGVIGGDFLPADLLWIGTIIPAVLETAINTDLPGNVMARVTENIYDSHTGKKLLLPQGTILIAQYNSSISYAQNRVQIVWDLLIRPDGYQLELQGMNGVDAKGMAGIKAKYNENWFEYIKAAGIISMFSVANAQMAEQAAKYASGDMAAAVVQQNSQFMNQVGGGIIGRAMNIQPTLTVESGTKINIMINKNIYLPPMENIPVTQKYTLH